MLKIAPAKHATLYNISIQSVSAAPRAAAAAAAPAAAAAAASGGHCRGGEHCSPQRPPGGER